MKNIKDGFITYEQFKTKCENSKKPYWKNCLKVKNKKNSRWAYISKSIEIASSITPCNNILEFGTYYMPLNKNSTLLELQKDALCNKNGVVWNLNNTPYPFDNKQFDLAMGLQVWEHLKDQKKSFNELIRISKHIILSFPYLWDLKDKTDCHHMIDKTIISTWTCKKKPEKIVRLGHRIIYHWTFP